MYLPDFILTLFMVLGFVLVTRAYLYVRDELNAHKRYMDRLNVSLGNLTNNTEKRIQDIEKRLALLVKPETQPLAKWTTLPKVAEDDWNDSVTLGEILAAKTERSLNQPKHKKEEEK
jgi:hypothetical protein